MAEKSDRKLRKRKGKKGEGGDEEKLSKDETEVAKYLRWNLKTKKSVMYGDEVYYFTGSKIVDLMLDSKWATGKIKKSAIKFTDRDSTYDLLDKMIMLGLFSRVHRIYKEKSKKDKKDEKRKSKEDKEQIEAKTNEVEQSPKKEKKDVEGKDGKEGKKKKKVKVSLEPHEQNIFLDSDDAVFIWIYDPVHPKTFFMGILLVIGTIAVCLFPLWPESFRVYSWYISVLAMIFIGVILFLAIFRYILFGILWAATMGKLHFWLLPNLTADCGFFESFVPIHECTITGTKNKEENNKIKEKEKGEDKVEERESIGKQATAREEKAGTSHDEEKSYKNNQDNVDGESWVKVTRSDCETEANADNDKTEINC
eukprot:gene15190-16757_t